MKAIKITDVITKNEYYGKNISSAARQCNASEYSIRNKRTKIPLPFVINNYLVEEIEIHES